MSKNKKICVIDYGMGNIRSIFNALSFLGYKNILLTDSTQEIRTSDLLILPGVGAFGDAMESLKNRGLISVLNEHAIKEKKPTIGICLGMQLFMTHSDEGSGSKGLNWLEGNVKKFDLDAGLKVPHMGWNSITFQKNHKLFERIPEKNDFYFVHSFFVECKNEYVLASCKYGNEFTAALAKDNLVAYQFHPEKSHDHGLSLLSNTIKYFF